MRDSASPNLWGPPEGNDPGLPGVTALELKPSQSLILILFGFQNGAQLSGDAGMTVQSDGQWLMQSRRGAVLPGAWGNIRSEPAARRRPKA